MSDDVQPDGEPTVFSSGYIVFRRKEKLQFLLMKHRDRWDLPKGHLDEGETKAQAALRELKEETGISPSKIWTDPQFLYSQRYWVVSRKNPKKKAMKELTIYLAFLKDHCEIRCSEHPDYQWWDWAPPHSIQVQTIDPVLQAVAQHIDQSTEAKKTLGLH